MVFVRIVGLVMSFVGAVANIMLSIPYIGNLVDKLLSLCATLTRLGAGGFAASGLPNSEERSRQLSFVPDAEHDAPDEPGIILYEYEACPFCRKVREALTSLDLDYVARPCPRETMKSYGFVKESRYRPEVQQAGGKLVFPYLVDRNTGKSMYESSDIVKYLWSQYGARATPHLTDRLGNMPVLKIGNLFASFARPLPRMGMLRTPSRLPEQPLELWSTEGSPFCRLAREALCTLELPYICRNVPHGAPRNRKKFKERFSTHLSKGRKALGLVKIPFLVDRNTNVQMSESSDIVAYLFKTYKIGNTVKESMLDYSTSGASKDHGTIR